MALFGETRIKDRRQDLQDGLLNESVKYVWNAELPLTATFFLDGSATHWRRPVRPIQELLFHRWPVLTGPSFELPDRHAVRTGSTPVPFDLAPRTLEMYRFDNLLHQSVFWRRVQGWLIAARRTGLLLAE
jgi:hypothetical protein